MPDFHGHVYHADGTETHYDSRDEYEAEAAKVTTLVAMEYSAASEPLDPQYVEQEAAWRKHCAETGQAPNDFIAQVAWAYAPSAEARPAVAITTPVAGDAESMLNNILGAL